MNNKGFAITGILYTIFILFIMTLFAVLAGLNTRLKLTQKSVMSFENNYSLDDENNLFSGNSNENINYRDTALYTGKYVFVSNQNPNLQCFTYLNRGKSFTSATFLGDNNCISDVSEGKAHLVALYKFN